MPSSPPCRTSPASSIPLPGVGRLFSAVKGRRSGGFTLLELMTVILLLGLIMGRVYPAGRELLDRMAVRGAREGVVGLFHRARMEAVARGGARILLSTDPPVLTVFPLGAPTPSIELALDQGVRLSLPNHRTSAEINFDGMGLGRVASQTIRFSRGSSEVELVVSSFGRVTRR